MGQAFGDFVAYAKRLDRFLFGIVVAVVEEGGRKGDKYERHELRV